MLIAIKDYPGALHEIISPFAEAGISLTRIESRPSQQRAWEYVFFVDFLGDAEDPAISPCSTRCRSTRRR